MQQQELVSLFDEHAGNYDRQWANLRPISEASMLLVSSVFSRLPPDAHVLCVGAGTGSEILYLAERFPGFRFTAVDPSTAMLEICRRRAEQHGIAARCTFHAGYVDTLPPMGTYHAATSFLVSHFMLDQYERSAFFRAIALRLLPGGYLASSDLATDTKEARYGQLLETWLRMMKAAELSTEAVERLRSNYQKDVAILPPEQVATIISSGGFDAPILLFQAGLIHMWCAARSAG